MNPMNSDQVYEDQNVNSLNSFSSSTILSFKASLDSFSNSACRFRFFESLLPVNLLTSIFSFELFASRSTFFLFRALHSSSKELNLRFHLLPFRRRVGQRVSSKLRSEPPLSKVCSPAHPTVRHCLAG